MNAVDVAAIHARMQAATEGPWSVEEDGPHDCEVRDPNGLTVGACADCGVVAVYDRADAEFMAHARTDVPALLSALKAAVSRAEEAEADRDALAAKLDQRIEDVIDEGFALKSLHVEGGSSDLAVTTSGAADHVMLAVFDAMGDMLGDATNYIETTVSRRGKGRIIVNVSRYRHPTPHSLREQAESERDAAVSIVERVSDAIAYGGDDYDTDCRPGVMYVPIDDIRQALA